MTELRRLIEAMGDPEHDEPNPPLVAVSVRAALYHIAFARLRGSWQDRPWFNLTPARRALFDHERHGARCAAERVLVRALKRGEILAFAAEDAGTDIEQLWEYEPAAWRDGAGIYGSDDAGYTLYAGDLSVTDPIFALDEVLTLAEPADEVRHAEEAQPRKAQGGRKAGTNGAPIAGFLRRIDALGTSALNETQETLGAWLREEYVSRGLKEPHVDNAKRDAIGAARGWFGVSEEG